MKKSEHDVVICAKSLQVLYMLTRTVLYGE